MKVESFPVIAVVILNYNSAEDTIACVDAVKRLDYPQLRIFLVDNASQDGSVDALQGAHPDVPLIVSESNRGYSGGNNLGIEKALQDPTIRYVWLLNNDALPVPDALTALVTVAEEHPKSLVGSLVLYPDGRFQRVGNQLNRWLGSLKSYHEQQVEEGLTVESLTGCSMLIPREALEAVGLLNEDYFLYFEDNDFCLRANKAGFRCVVAPQSKIFHQEGASTGRNKPLVTYYYQRNRLLLAQRFFSPVQWILVQLYTRYRLFRSTIKTIAQKHPDAKAHHRAFTIAVRDFYAGVKGKCPHNI